MKEIEKAFYEKYCLRCKYFQRCPWLCLSNDTCLELTKFEDRKEAEAKKNGFKDSRTIGTP